MQTTKTQYAQDAYDKIYEKLQEIVGEKGNDAINSLEAIEYLAGARIEHDFSLWTLLLKLECLGKVEFSKDYSILYVK